MLLIIYIYIYIIHTTYPIIIYYYTKNKLKKVLTFVFFYGIFNFVVKRKCLKTEKTPRGVAQLGQSAWFGTRRSQVRILSPRQIRRYAGVVQWQNTSLPSQIRGFDSHHPLSGKTGATCPQLSWIEQRPSKPWVGGSNPFGHV